MNRYRGAKCIYHAMIETSEGGEIPDGWYKVFLDDGSLAKKIKLQMSFLSEELLLLRYIVIL